MACSFHKSQRGMAGSGVKDGPFAHRLSRLAETRW
jgi:hypothetical protein